MWAIAAAFALMVLNARAGSFGIRLVGVFAIVRLIWMICMTNGLLPLAAFHRAAHELLGTLVDTALNEVC